MKYLITSYTYSGNLSNLAEHFDEIKQLELSDDLCCIHHQSGHKCNFVLHKADKKFSGFYNMITIVMKYKTVNIRIKLFRSGSIIFHYFHKMEIPAGNIINNFKEKLKFNTELTKWKLVMKVVEWKTSGNDLEKIKAYLQRNYKDNYDIIEHKSSSLPSISFAVHGNKVRLGKKSITCQYSRIEDKEIDNFMLVLQKYFNRQNNEIEDNNNQDNENEVDEDKQMTIII